MGSLPVKQINAVVVDPRNPKMVFAAGPSGIFRSTDAGLNWQASDSKLGSIVALALNPNQADSLFAATAEGSLFRSNNGGQSWNFVSTIPPK